MKNLYRYKKDRSHIVVSFVKEYLIANGKNKESDFIKISDNDTINMLNGLRVRND